MSRNLFEEAAELEALAHRIEAEAHTEVARRASIETKRGPSSTEYRIIGTLDQVFAAIREKFKEYNPVGYGTRVQALDIVYPKENEYTARMSRSNSCD